MAFCRNCGKELKPEHKFCGNCGEPVVKINDEYIYETTETVTAEEQGSYNEAPVVEPIAEDVFYESAPKGKLSVGMLVWAILNTIASFSVCCVPIGVLPLIFSILTCRADYEVSQKNRKRALVWNIVATVLIVAYCAIMFIATVLYPQELGEIFGEFEFYDYGLPA